MKQTNERLEQLAERVAKYKYVLLVLTVGLILLLLPSEQTEERVSQRTEGLESRETDFSVEREEQRLEEVISGIRGAGACRILLSVSSTEETELARDGEKTVILSEGNGKESAVTVRSWYPVYRGAVVVCAGADDPTVKYEILRAVMTYTGLDSGSITICAMHE